MNAEELRQLAGIYAGLEGRLQEFFALTIGSYCAACAIPCCRADLCDETCGSVFLDEVRRVAFHTSEPLYSERDGWLGASGCGLVVGRPPVCYAYVCEELYGMVPTHVADLLREVCERLEEVYADVRGGADLHELGPDAMRHLAAVEILPRMEALHVYVDGLVKQLAGES